MLELEVLKGSIKYIALASAIFSTLFFYKYSHGRAKYFLFSIWFIVITEFSYKFLFYKVFDQDIRIVKIVVNTYTVIQFSFYILWYRYLVKNPLKRRTLLWFFILFIIAFATISAFLQEFDKITQSYTYAIGVILLISTIVIYFMDVLSGEFILRFERSVMFWFSLGLLLFHVPFMPFQFIAEYYNFNSNIYIVILFGLNLIMHSCFVYGVLWSKKKYNY